MLLIETPDALEAVDNDPRAKELALACVQWLRKTARPLWLDWLESAELCMASADKADEAARFYCHALLVAIHDVVQRAPEAWGLKPLNGDIGEDVDEFEDVTISRACKESASFILLSMSIILSMLAKDPRRNVDISPVFSGDIWSTGELFACLQRSRNNDNTNNNNNDNNDKDNHNNNNNNNNNNTDSNNDNNNITTNNTNNNDDTTYNIHW